MAECSQHLADAPHAGRPSAATPGLVRLAGVAALLSCVPACGDRGTALASTDLGHPSDVKSDIESSPDAGGDGDIMTSFDLAGGDGSPADPSGPQDTSDGPGPICDLVEAAARFDDTLRPNAPNCGTCHDMTVPPGLLKAPGPPWYHPSDASASVDYLLGNELVDPVDPAQSLFLLKPLDQASGGVQHTGGELVFGGTKAHEAFLMFLDVMAPCAPFVAGHGR